MYFQSFLVPLQGFLNAIVYGWTREDFAKLLAIGRSNYEGWVLEGANEDNNNASASHNNVPRPRFSSILTRHEAEENSCVDDSDTYESSHFS